MAGKMYFEPRDTSEDEAEWFESRFGCAKYPERARVKGRVIDLERERYERHTGPF